jgi:hypothetical protein
MPWSILDFVADSSNQKLIPNPAHDGEYALDLLILWRPWHPKHINSNPDSLVYDWVELDSMFLVANQFSKKIHLIIAPGFHSPE